MSLTLANAVRTLMVDALAGSVDAGSGAGKLRIYDGSRPAGPGTAITTQNLLAEITCSDPAFGSGANGVATINGTPLSTTGVDDGDATWFRALDSDNVAKFDGSVTATGGGGDLTLATTTVSTGATVRVTGGTLTQPGS